VTVLFRALLIPLSGLCIGAGVLIGGKAGHVLIIAGTVGFGVAAVLALADH
jgi:hypothetical protein